MIRILLKLSIGTRLKITISALVSAIIIILGFILYGYQKQIIFEQAKQNSFASVDDLIHFTQNEIDASHDKIQFFGQAVINLLNAIGEEKQSKNEFVTYTAYLENSTQPIEIKVPVFYRGNTRLQGDSSILTELKKIGVEYFIYYQKTDGYFVEIINSESPTNTVSNTVNIYPVNEGGNWQLSSKDSIITNSHWTGQKWVQTIRLFTYDSNNKINGAIIAGIQERNENKLGKIFYDKTYYKTGSCYQLSLKGEITYHHHIPNFTIIDNPALKQITSQKLSDHAGCVELTDSVGIKKYLFFKYYPAIFNNVVIEIPANEIYASLFVLRNGIIIAILVITICIYYIITIIANTITKRLDKAVKHAKSISSGDLTVSIPIDSTDELAELAIALNQMNAVLKDTVLGISSMVENVNESTNELIKISNNIAEGANYQASSLEEISSSMEEMTSTIEQNAFNAKKTAAISDESARNIQNSSDVLHESVSYLSQIVNKTTVINDISFQTNLLALNAAVEAARAGEHGRGFSVVASEVRKLAERSRIAALEISKVSQSGKSIAQDAGTKLSEHLPLVHQTADWVKEISASSTEQSLGIEQINNAIQGLNNITQQNVSEANNIVENMNRLSDNSKKLAQLTKFFKT